MKPRWFTEGANSQEARMKMPVKNAPKFRRLRPLARAVRLWAACAALLALPRLPTAAEDVPEGVVSAFSCPWTKPKRGQPEPKVSCWLPAKCEYVRGVIVAGSFGSARLVREAAKAEGLGVMNGPIHAPSGKETLAHIDGVLEQWAKASGHPEIRGSALLTASISAGVIWARNVAYAAPDRVMGVVHIAGGNMHHGMVDENKTLAGVPFIAMNGEFESCGPDGGIRPHLGFDTQWYLLAEAMLARRKEDPRNLMSMVVIPGRGHTAWNQELGALFVRKAARYRLPKERRDGSTPAKCVAVELESGWLTDRNVKHPQHEPAPYDKYGGDKSQAFWHFDEEMAQAVCRYHKDGIRPGQGRGLFRPAGLFEQLWPLGERMDIAFQGDTPEGYAAALRDWIGRKTGGKLEAGIIGGLTRGLASGLKKDATGGAVDEGAFREMCQRVCFAHDEAWRPVQKAIEEARLPAEFKALLREQFAETLLVLWPSGRAVPDLPLRAVQAWIAAIPANADAAAVKARLQDRAASNRAVLDSLYGQAPADSPPTLDKLLQDFRLKDAQAGWAAVDELAKVGAPAIAELVRALDYAGPPANFRAAAALGKMGAPAACALQDLRRAAEAGSRLSEMESELCGRAFEAIAAIEQALAVKP
jgi:hypothetical protein